MKKCKYLLNGECQLYSIACGSDKECGGCKWENKKPDDEPCVRCDAEEDDTCGKQ